MKLVSVVVLSYRSAETIVETLESIKNQTYPNIELIITDDASPDNTVQVVQHRASCKYQQRVEGCHRKIL